MLKLILIAFLPFLFFSGETPDTPSVKNPNAESGTLRKLIPDSGTVTMSVDLNDIGRAKLGSRNITLAVDHDSFMEILVFNNELRTPLPGSVSFTGSAKLPRMAKTRSEKLFMEKTDWQSDYSMVIRDESGQVLFNILGMEYVFDPAGDVFGFENARLLLSDAYARELGTPGAAGRTVGTISFNAAMRAIEISNIVDGEVDSAVMPANPEAGSVPGPDVVVGELLTMEQPSAASGGYVGIGIGTTSCNFGTVNLNWNSLSSGSNDHPVIPQNLYRMSGGANNNDRFEQIGQSWLKHAFTALTENACSLGCNGVGGSRLGSGCSDPYIASLNYSQSSLGSRAWVNPFTGFFPVNPSPNSHTGHTHVSYTHRVMVAVSDLNPAQNPGATYFGEAQYVTPHEYAWCQSNPGQCNMYNNVSYKQYTVSGGPSSFTFPAAGNTQRQKPAVAAWTGATIEKLEPAPGQDGVGNVAYKVTNPSPGVWHYEYAVYNQTIDRAIQSFGLPLTFGLLASNVGFHAPPQQPPAQNDGTFNSAGYSSTPWTSTRGLQNLLWNTETFAQNQNANAIRWGTLYNFRFDSNRPPKVADAIIGFLKTGAPVTVQVQVPDAPIITVSGRIMSGKGRGITNAVITIQDINGNQRSVTTNRYGQFSFDNLAAAESYTFSIAAGARYNFAPQTLLLNNSTDSMNFFPN